MLFLKYKLYKLKKDSAPSPAFRSALRNRLVSQQPVVTYQPVMFLRYSMVAAVVALVVIFSTGSYAYASSAVTQGSALYPLKRGLEKIEGNLQLSPEARARYHARMLDRRAREISYRLRHDKPLRPNDMVMLAQAMNLSVEELRELKNDETALELAKTELKLKIVNSLTTFRTQIELADDLTQEQKERYLEAIDERLEKIQTIETTTP